MTRLLANHRKTQADAYRKIRFVPGGCWEWGGTTNAGGYGVARVNGKAAVAHRYFYELEYGPIPTGLVLDHLCRTRNCVNPTHLEAVTSGENSRRGIRPTVPHKFKATCSNGHQFDFWSAGQRRCRACTVSNTRAWRARNAERWKEIHREYEKMRRKKAKEAKRV